MKNRIKVERAELDITQQQLAEAVGVSRQTIVAIEKNRFLPSTPLALKISRSSADTLRVGNILSYW